MLIPDENQNIDQKIKKKKEYRSKQNLLVQFHEEGNVIKNVY